MTNEEIGKAMARVFQDGGDGQAVFEHLTSLFYDTSCYTKGDSYDSIYKLGGREVLLYIIAKMSQANQPSTIGGNDDN